MAQTTNGQQAVPPGSSEPSQQLVVNAQYVKDLSFENPRAPQGLAQPTTAPAVEINIDVKAQGLSADVYEVVLSISASAKINDDVLFVVELAYGAVVTVRNVPQEALAPILLVETPRLMFPFARNIVADATRDGGYPPLMINPVDFSELLRRNQQQSAETPPTA